MKTLNVISSMIVVVALAAGTASAQRNVALGDNAALRYWAAFAQMQDSVVTGEQAKELNAILAGTAPYDDLKYKGLVENNKGALQIMARGTALPKCDWGLDYNLGFETPMDYVRSAVPLGRLNVLYAFHLLRIGDKDGAVRTLAAGLRFAQDVANGGTLFAAVTAENLIVTHLRAIAFAVHVGELSPAQRSVLQRSVVALGPNGLDWQSAVRREMSMTPPPITDPPWQASTPSRQIAQAYLAVLDDPSTLPKLEELLAATSQDLPDPKRVLEEKQDLSDQLQQTRALLQAD